MSADAERFSEVGRGPFSRGSAAVYWALVIEALIVLTSLPGLLAFVLLDRSVGNAPLFALAAVPLGPSLSAAVHVWRHWQTTPPADRDLAPAAHYWRGYRLNWRDVLLWWVPTVLVLAVLAVNVAGAGALEGSGGAFALVSVLIGVSLLVWAGHALVLSSLFSFRARDVARLAAHYLAARPASTVGVLALVVVGAGVALLATDWLLVLLASPLVALLVRNATPVVADVTTRFTAP
ncbi:DUF624 domain-containing protein [Cellulomonas fimi]|uniref:DUF624 domain-containing protein n=1 Tax=Cellulomonas fimi TaxID=1708 RepID=UPI00059F4D04|nr:DUF624 domain-containing protein [Cellulomonas fimi]NNH05787.1 DUF624 domain-containing protein [Cellulomonas fimi]